MSPFTSFLTPTGLPRFRQPLQSRQTVAPESSHTMQRSMLGSTVSYNVDHPPENSRTDLLSDRYRTVIAAASTESFGSLARDTSLVREQSSAILESTRMTSWLHVDLGNLALSDAVAEGPGTSSPTDELNILTAARKLSRAQLEAAKALFEVIQSMDSSQIGTAGGSSQPEYPTVDPSMPPSISEAEPKPSSSPPPTLPPSPYTGYFIFQQPEGTDGAEPPFRSTSEVGAQGKGANTHSEAAVEAPHHISTIVKEEVTRTYLRDGSVKLVKGHPFLSSLAGPSQEPQPGRSDRGKPLPPTPTTARLSQRSVFPSDHYSSPFLGKLGSQSVDIDEVPGGFFPPRSHPPRYQVIESSMSRRTWWIASPPVSQLPLSTPCVSQGLASTSPTDDAPRARPQSRFSQGSTRARLRPTTRSRFRRSPLPPSCDNACTSAGSGSSEQESASPGDVIMLSPPNPRNSMEITRVRGTDEERKAKMPRLTRQAQAISLHDELFPTCLAPFPSRTTRLLGSPSPQELQDEVATPAERRSNNLALLHNNSSRLSVTLKEFTLPLQRIFRSQSRQTESAHGHEHVAPTPGPADVDYTGETLFTRPAGVTRRKTGSWFRRKAPQTVYKEGYEPQEHFASIRGQPTSAPVSEAAHLYRRNSNSAGAVPVTGTDFTDFRKAEAASEGREKKDASSFQGRLKRKMSQIRSRGRDQGVW